METLTIRHFPEEMEQLPVDPENLNRVLLSGLFEEKAKTRAPDGVANIV